MNSIVKGLQQDLLDLIEAKGERISILELRIRTLEAIVKIDEDRIMTLKETIKLLELQISEDKEKQ